MITVSGSEKKNKQLQFYGQLYGSEGHSKVNDTSAYVGVGEMVKLRYVSLCGSEGDGEAKIRQPTWE